MRKNTCEKTRAKKHVRKKTKIGIDKLIDFVYNKMWTTYLLKFYFVEFASFYFLVLFISISTVTLFAYYFEPFQVFF